MKLLHDDTIALIVLAIITVVSGSIVYTTINNSMRPVPRDYGISTLELKPSQMQTLAAKYEDEYTAAQELQPAYDNPQTTRHGIFLQGDYTVIQGTQNN